MLNQFRVKVSPEKIPVCICVMGIFLCIVYWLLATFFLLVLCLLGVWSTFEMLRNAYSLVEEFEMPKKAIIGGLYLMCFGVFCTIFIGF